MPGLFRAITLSRVRPQIPGDKASWSQTAPLLPFQGAPVRLPVVAQPDDVTGPRTGFAQPKPLTVVITPPVEPAPVPPPAVRRVVDSWVPLPPAPPVRTLAPAPAPPAPAPPRVAIPRPPSWTRPEASPRLPAVAGWSRPTPPAPPRPAVASAVNAAPARRVTVEVPRVQARPVTTFQGASNYYSPAALKVDAIARQAAATAVTTSRPAATPAPKPIGPQTGTQAVATNKPAVTPSSGKADPAPSHHWQLVATAVVLVAVGAYLTRG